jgi:carbon-monoxide dehydrogenase small subunit
MMKIIHCTINGKEQEVPIDERESLLEMLHNRLMLTSVKKGCEVGECGACTVLVDGKATDSCIYLAEWADGKHILTVEGLQGPNGELNPIQQAFIDETAVQCGFCIPGIIMSAVEIAGTGKKYTREQNQKTYFRTSLPLHRLPEHNDGSRKSGKFAGRQRNGRQNGSVNSPIASNIKICYTKTVRTERGFYQRTKVSVIVYFQIGGSTWKSCSD